MKKNGGQAAQALGRSRGGWSTTSHTGCRAARTGITVVLTAGPWHESPVCATVCTQVPPEPSLTHALMDKASARQALGEHRIKQAMVPVIPAKSKRIISLDSDKSLYKVREKVERGFNNLKQWRRIARRYAKLSQTFLAWIHLVAVWMIIK